MQARLIVAFTTLAIALTLGTAGATPRDDLDQARKAFREGQFAVALEKYNALLYPELKLASAEDNVEAYINLGVCRIELGDVDGAKREFERALELDPNKQLDTLVITNKKAIELFDDTKADIRTRKEREAAKAREAGERERLRKIRESLIGVRESNYVLNFLPGAGQFQNGQPLKGGLFLGGQAVTASISIGIWYYLVNKYGIRSDKVPLTEGPRVRLLQQLEIGSGLAFFGLYIWGVVDAHRNYKRTVRTELDESLLPPELRDVEKKPATRVKTSWRERLHVTPIFAPDSAGVGIGWEMN